MVLTMWRSLTFLAGLIALLAGPASGQTIGPGDGARSAVLLGTTLKVFTYRPANCELRLVLAVFHGTERDAAPYRDHARPLADKLCALVVSPELDKTRFPISSFQLGGVFLKGAFVAPGKRPVDLVAPLIAWARASAGQPNLTSALLGHSAGGQFLGRVAAFAATDATHIVLANPSTWVLPSTTERAPYGFGQTGSAAEAEQALRTYLGLPITVLLGAADTGSHNLAMDPEAVAQGANRLMRGRNAFAMAESVAREHGWRFGWTKLEVPDVGHSATRMFASSQAVEAFR